MSYCHPELVEGRHPEPQPALSLPKGRRIDHLQLSILTQGPKIAQIGLGYGADDFGSTMIEENVVSAADNKFILNAEEFERLITDAGYQPSRRNKRYELL